MADLKHGMLNSGYGSFDFFMQNVRTVFITAAAVLPVDIV